MAACCTIGISAHSEKEDVERTQMQPKRATPKQRTRFLNVAPEARRHVYEPQSRQYTRQNLSNKCNKHRDGIPFCSIMQFAVKEPNLAEVR